MTPECTPAQLEVHALANRYLVGHFDGGRITEGVGGLPLPEVDHRLGRLASCFSDFRNPNSVEHSVQVPEDRYAR